MMLISVILLNYNKPNLTLACMSSLKTNFSKELLENSMEIIIVDNASSDNSVEILKKEIKIKNYLSVHLISSDKNNGFGKGCNIAAETAKWKYLLFLNNDTIVKDKGILDMAKFLDKNKLVSILGGQLKNPDGSRQTSVGSFYTLGKAILLLLGFQRFGVLDRSPNNITKVDWVKGGLFMIRSEAFNRLGGFDEKIFMYTEDMELCYRAKKMGFQIYFYPDIEVVHKEHGSTNRTFAIVNIYKNLLYFYKKHRTYLEYFVLKLILVTKALVLIFLGALIGSNYLKSTYKQALQNIE